MTEGNVADKGWVVRATVIEEAGAPNYHYFLVGSETDADAVAAVRSFPGILSDDNVKTMRPLSKTEMSEFKQPLKRGEVRLHEGGGVT
jgi:hypothetical protein